MNTTIKLAAYVIALAAINPALHADTFGTPGNEFTISFVDIGNAGNSDESGSPWGGVSYGYRMGTYEISLGVVNKAIASGLTGVGAGYWGASQPAGDMTWYEIAAFVNFLNTSSGHQAAYQLTGVTALTLWSSADAWQADGENRFRHKNAYYFLPNEDEWYKAAYHKNDGVTANYWDYATGSDSVPDGIDFAGDPAFDAVFFQGGVNPQPNAVTNVGLLSPYGTAGQSGNMAEWLESAGVPPNDIPSEAREVRGGTWGDAEVAMRSSSHLDNVDPAIVSNGGFGFRVASVPEPSSAVLMIGTGALLLLRRSKQNTK